MTPSLLGVPLTPRRILAALAWATLAYLIVLALLSMGGTQ